ncbi:MAG: aminotransferase class I/II-fold pyridoxal phosphate-dependent enzyme [Desulfobacterales bacterium]|jgi:aspartate aminotransferase|nr:aminotransferase class I/II-fold pyridoxal phosphate-dependent enzyme [Desulfobacterales bacterium]
MTIKPEYIGQTIGCDQAPEIQLNLNVRGLSPSATVAINERSDQLIKEGREIFKLGLGQSPFPVPDIIVEELKKNAFRKEYLPVRGLLELRKTVAEHHRRTFGIECTAEDVLVGPGSKELMFILQLVYYGDLVIPTPAWVSYEPQAQIIGRRVQKLPTSAKNGWCVTPDRLDALCRTDPLRPRIVVLNYPSNPTGLSYTSGELHELAKIARKYRVILLSDEIYGKIHHEEQHVSVVPMYPEGTIFSGGLSKWCGAGGWRLGVFVFPSCLRWLLDAMAVVASETFTSTSAPIQYAAVRAFQDNIELDQYLFQVRRILGSLGKRLAATLKKAGVNILFPHGGFYLFPDFTAQAEYLKSRGITTSVDFCERLLDETGVAILPGYDFGRPLEELTARLAYVNFDGKKALEAAIHISADKTLGEEFLQKYCKEPIIAIERLCEWVN